jgi:Ran GTPase-activating protein (RanGAP) involved in mRNA processing and transport
MLKIASYLLRTRCLLTLDLTNNQIGPKAAHSIGFVIKDNTRLKVLKLGMNRIDDDKGGEMIRQLEKNVFLEELDVSSNYLGEKTARELSIALKFNKTIRIIDLSKNSEFPVDSELKSKIESSPSLIKLDLRSTKCQISK